MRTFTLSQLMTMCRQLCDQENSDFISDAELKSKMGTVYAELYGILVKSGARYFEYEQEIRTAANAAAVGVIQFVAKANMVDGETFTLHDGYGQLTFEFDVDGSGVLVPGNIRMNISGSTTPTSVALVAETAINTAAHADGTGFRITALNLSTTVTLANDATGAIGNQRSYESVADSGFTISDMAGGGGSYPVPADYLATVGVDYVVSAGTGERRAIPELMVQERNWGSGCSGTASAYSLKGHTLVLFPNPPAGQVYKHIYVPQPPKLIQAPTSTVIDVVTLDGENFLTWGTAVLCMAKAEEDLTFARDERDRARMEVEEWATLRALNSPRRQVLEEEPQYYAPGEYWPR